MSQNKMPPDRYSQMIKHLTRKKIKNPFIPASAIQRPKEILEIEAFQDFNARNKLAGGGMLVQPSADGSRPGYSDEFGPNIRKLTKSDSFEVQVKRDGKKFYETFNYGSAVTGPKAKYSTEKQALEAAKEYRDSVKNLPKMTGKQSAGGPKIGFKKKTGGQAEIRKILNQFIKEGKTSFSNEDIRNLINKNLFPDDDQFRSAVDVVKKESEFKNLKFIVKQRDRADFFTDPFIRKTIKENYGKVKQENLAKLIFPDKSLTTSKSRLNYILSDMADKGEIKRLGQGKFSEERIEEFDPSPESKKRADIATKRRKKIDILGGKDYEKELFDFKKEVQENLGLKKIKTSGKISGKSFLFDPIDMGHQSSIKQLEALKQKLRPEDLNPQFYRANREGIRKFKGGVKTLEKALNKKFYPNQKKLYKQAQKFLNAGKAVPEDLQNKIIKSNEDIQKFIDDTVKKYPLLKNRVNAITVDPINLNVKRGDNVLKQLGIGLVDQDLEKIKTGSLDDLTIKGNLAEQTLREAVDAGLIDEKVGRQKLNKFLNVKTVNPNLKTDKIILNKIQSYSKLPKCKVNLKADGGRIGFANSIECIQDGLKEQKIAAQQGNKKAAQELIQVGKVATRAGLLKNVLGPGALLGEAVYEGAVIGNKVLGGTPANIAWAESYLSYLDPRKYRGELDPLKMRREDMLTREVEDADGNIKTIDAPGSSVLRSGFAAQDQLSAFNKAIEDRDIAKKARRIDQYLPAAAEAREQGARADQSADIISSDAFKDASRIAQEYLQGQTGANIAKYRTEDFGRFESGKEKADRKRRMQKMFPEMPRQFLTEKTSDLLDRTQFLRSLGFDVSTRDLMAEQERLRSIPLSQDAITYGPEQVYGARGAFFSKGGIAGLSGGDKSGPPPERGPNPQGLLSLKNRVRNL